MLSAKHLTTAGTMPLELNARNAHIFRICHRDNAAWIFRHGLHCKNSRTYDPKYVEIGNHELISKRSFRTINHKPFGTLSDYVPFYFTPHSPMLLNIKTGWAGIKQRTNDEIVIMQTSLHRLSERGTRFVFTDRHAYLEAAEFFSDVRDLGKIDWPSLQARNFKKSDIDKFERYQAEALIHRHLPIEEIDLIGCHSQSVADRLSEIAGEAGVNVRVTTKPAWYFS